jgi:hypothetical protein
MPKGKTVTLEGEYRVQGVDFIVPGQFTIRFDRKPSHYDLTLARLPWDGVAISRELAKELGLTTHDRVKVTIEKIPVVAEIT